METTSKYTALDDALDLPAPIVEDFIIRKRKRSQAAVSPIKKQKNKAKPQKYVCFCCHYWTHSQIPDCWRSIFSLRSPQSTVCPVCIFKLKETQHGRKFRIATKLELLNATHDANVRNIPHEHGCTNGSMRLFLWFADGRTCCG